jgi:Zn-dependent peptidase ImmA (M78 family)
MEEISHVFLGHKASRLAIENRDKHGNVIARDYNSDVEEEAYATGAAALVPYGGLKKFVEQGKTTAEIARHYNVSKALVEYRIKISRLWGRVQGKSFSKLTPNESLRHNPHRTKIYRRSTNFECFSTSRRRSAVRWISMSCSIS